MPSTSPRNSDQAPNDLPVIPGYRVESVLGRGAMSTVYFGRQIDMDRPVAIKVLSDEIAARDDLVEQLLVEARIAARLNHPNIVRALDAGFIDGRCYFVMEFVAGETLRDRIRRLGPLSLEEVRSLGKSLARALNELDQHHLVHRDIKPANILLGDGGAVHLVDFGLACVELSDSEGDASVPTVGTPQYMSPEQISDPASVDIRSDLFSLGSTLSHALTGICPFEAAGAGESLSRVLYEEPTPLLEQNPHWPSDLCGAIDSLLAKDRSARCASPAAFLDAIEQPRVSEARVKSPRHWIAASVLCGLVGIGVLVFRGNQGDEERAPATHSTSVLTVIPESERVAALSDAALFAALCADPEEERHLYIEAGQYRLETFIDECKVAVRRATLARSFDEASRLVGDELAAEFETRFGVAVSQLPTRLFDVMSVLRSELDLVRQSGLAADQDGLLNIFIADCDSRAEALTRREYWATKESICGELFEVSKAHEQDWELLLPPSQKLFREYCETASATINEAWQGAAHSEFRRLEGCLESRFFVDVTAGIQDLRDRGVCSLTSGWEGALRRLESEVDVARQGLGKAITAALEAIALPRVDGQQRFEGRPVNGIKLVIQPTVTLLPSDLGQLGDLADQGVVLRRLHELVSHLARSDTPEMPGQRALFAYLDGQFEKVLDVVPAQEADPLLRHIRFHAARAHAVIHHVSSAVEQQARERLQQAMDLMEQQRWEEASRQISLIHDDSNLQGTDWMRVFGATVASLAKQITVRRGLVASLGQRRATVRIIDSDQRRVRLSWENEAQLSADFQTDLGPYRATGSVLQRLRRCPTVDPASMGGLRTSFPWKPGTSLVLSFQYKPGEKRNPRLMALRLFGLNTILLSRLHSPAKERSLPLHGWGATLESSRVYGWGHTFFGPLSGTGAALLAAKLKHREAFFEAGQTYDVSFTLDDTRQELTVIVNGEMAHRARYLPFESLNDRIQLFIPMPHEIRALEIEGILREE